MDLLNLIEKRVEDKIKEVSQKDLFIFYSLSKSPCNQVGGIESLLSSMDKICYASFITPECNVKELVKRKQGEQSIQGMHYSNNLIELIAMAKQDYQFEEVNLKQYIINCSLKEQFIINMFFKDLIFTPKIAENNIENIIDNILFSNEPKGSVEDIMRIKS